jgi:phage tail-like protein
MPGLIPMAPPFGSNGKSSGAAASGGQNVLGKRSDPFGSFQFKVDLGLVSDVSALFSEVSGLEANLKYDEIKEGGQNGFVHRLPTRVEFGNLVLRRGYTDNNEFYTWCLSSLSGKIDRRLITISLVSFQLGPAPKTVFSWTFVDAYPIKWTGPALKAADHSMAMESLELVHRGFRLD